MKLPHPQYPRPTFVREDWISLNGQWEFDFDDNDTGLAKRWYLPARACPQGRDSGGKHRFKRRIKVPFPFQSKLSGIGDTSSHDVVWYRRKFNIPDGCRGKRILLHFGAVDYLAAVWLNGELVVRHRGGYVPFSSDITDLVIHGDNTLVVRAENRHSPHQPQGRQSTALEARGAQCTRCTGIWQTVWIEPVSPHHIHHVHCTPDVDNGRITVLASVSGRTDETELRVAVSFAGKPEAELRFPVSGDSIPFTISLKNHRTWSPEQPNLYDMMLELVEGEDVTDRALVYFGMRKIEADGRKIRLNGKPLYQRLVLDRGYWPDGTCTAPNDDAFKKDLELAKSLGFNGVRMHQKIADPRYLYWADRLGMLVWAEMPSCTEFSDTAVANFAHEWRQVIHRDYNHPCIIAWVPFNESWGVQDIQSSERQREFVGEIVAIARNLDGTRLIVDNSGWDHLDTDIVDIHNYTQEAADFGRVPFKPLKVDRIELDDHKAMVDGVEYEGQPVIVSEYGGIGMKSPRPDKKGYRKHAKTNREFLKRYRALTEAILANKALSGFCYTQLCDVERDTNGLLTCDRKPKVKPETIAKINSGTPKARKAKKKT